MLSGKKLNQKLGRDILNVEQWATGKIEATPYGVGEKMMIGGVKNSNGIIDNNNNNNNKGEFKSNVRSNIQFDHFTFSTDQDSLDREMPKGKRTVPISESNLTANRVFGKVH